MARVLIFPGPSEVGGPLMAAAERISTCLVSRGHRVDVVRTFDPLDVATQDSIHGVILGARLVQGSLPGDVQAFLQTHQAWLAKTTSALFYISTGETGDDPSSREESSRGREWSAQDQAAMGPILRYQSYGLFKRLAVFAAGGTSVQQGSATPANAAADTVESSAPQEELSDWREVEALADRFADHLEAGMTVG